MNVSNCSIIEILNSYGRKLNKNGRVHKYFLKYLCIFFEDMGGFRAYL